jgi:predicted double-glycine peptidase
MKGILTKKNYLIPSLLGIFLYGCHSPVAPLQADTGTVYNYGGRNYALKQTVSKQGSVSQVKDGTVTISGIPIFKQGNDNTCGQAVMASILNFWGNKTTYQTVINETNLGNMPTDLNVIETYLNSKGLNAKAYKKSSLEYLKYLVDQGKPPIVLLDFGGLQNEHYVVVSGYNDLKDTILINDSRNGAFIPLKSADFEAKWKNQSLANVLIFGDKFDRPIFDISA